MDRLESLSFSARITGGRSDPRFCFAAPARAALRGLAVRPRLRGMERMDPDIDLKSFLQARQFYELEKAFM